MSIVTYCSLVWFYPRLEAGLNVNQGPEWTPNLSFQANVDVKSFKYSENYGNLNIYHCANSIIC